MNNFFRFFAMTLAVMPIAAHAHAQARLDERVQEFLGAKVKASEASLPVIVMYRQNPAARIARMGEARDARETSLKKETDANQDAVFGPVASDAQSAPKALWVLNGSLARLTQGQIKALSQNEKVQAILYSQKPIRAPKSTAAPAAMASRYTYGLQKLNVPDLLAKRPELTGKGVRVGILDTGIDPDHPDLKGKLALYKDFTDKPSQVPSDHFEHGTHVAGTIAGGAASGEAIGVAPEVKLVVGKIFSDSGDSTKESILMAMQWIADPDGNPRTADQPRVVNDSWGDSDPYDDRDPDTDPFCRTVDTWSSLGIIPVFSAGNSGPHEGTVGTPAACPGAFAVAATNINDQSPWFSSVGPSMWKTQRFIKPEISAPGMDIDSARPGGGYQKMTGTSMSSPHITGSFALLLQARPGLSVKEAEDALIAGSVDLGDPGKDNTFGWGRPDLLKTIVGK